MKLQLAVVTVLALLLFTSHASGQSEAEKTYKAKCVACHGADGSGTQVGQKLGTHDFHSSQVRGESEADIEQIIGKGKNKMPAYEKSLKPDEIKALAAYVHELVGKK
jgi:cytochrome c6